MLGDDDSDYDYDADCPICHSYMTREPCWKCMGEGGWHDCGDDCCPCLDKEEITQDCEECDGEGEYLVCSALPHTDEQMARYSEQQDKAEEQRLRGL